LALPAKRRNKDSLNEITASNVATTFTIKRDRKKKTIEFLTHYKQIGIIDGCETSKAVERFTI